MGKRAEGLGVIHELEARERQQWVPPTFLAIAYAGIGDRDHAIAWLETAVQKKTFSVRSFLNWDRQWFSSLRDDPRFIDLEHRVRTTAFTS